MQDKRTFYINGAFVPPAKPADLEVVNPATEQPCAVISNGSQADTDAAVAAARAAFPAWRATPLEDRLAMLDRIVENYSARADEMATAMRLEMGAPVDYALSAQWDAGDGGMREAIRAARAFKFERKTSNDDVFYEPIGVAALITPWNWPMSQIVLKVIPALAAGCTVILKPSEVAPLSGHLFAEMIHDAGVPAGVFNLVNGDGPGVGAQLSAHPGVDMVSFTGSTRAGALISKAAADSFKRVSLELGGKGANVIFEDADANAVKRGVRECFGNVGQSCNAPTRMLVQRSIYDAAVEKAAEVAEATRVDRSDKPGRHLGPLVSQAQWDKVQGLIQAGIDEGARLVAGGTGRPEGLNNGYYGRPTVFADVSNDMTIAQTEIFGPVLSMIPFEDEAEAIEIANDTPYGLTNYVQTQDSARARRMAHALNSGMVEVNGAGLGYDTPFGGVKHSGNAREGSVWGMEEYLIIKAVAGYPDD
ncbi:MAG: aldehyde dehydrogenase family protein [Rhodobacteraceae bacterium]|nr:aldehyde dehydrogenase family protein [Paracoccaceae bacterium]